MKYKTLIFAFTLIAAQSLCTTSCGDDEYFNEHSHYGITTANSGLQIGGSLVLDIDAQKASWQDHITAYNSIKYLNMTWSTSGLPTWINQTPLSGGGYDYGADNIDYTIAETKVTMHDLPLLHTRAYQHLTMAIPEAITAPLTKKEHLQLGGLSNLKTILMLLNISPEENLHILSL